jgi:hypothetical protein
MYVLPSTVPDLLMRSKANPRVAGWGEWSNVFVDSGGRVNLTANKGRQEHGESQSATPDLPFFPLHAVLGVIQIRSIRFQVLGQ